MADPTGQNWTTGRLGAPVGTQEWADAVRLKLVAHVDHLGEDDDGWLGWLELLDNHRAWSLLTKHDGSTFRTREEFCAYKRPWGLGTPIEKLEPYVMAAFAKRGIPLEEAHRRWKTGGVSSGLSKEEVAALGRAAKRELVDLASGDKSGPDDAKELSSLKGNDCPLGDAPPERTIKQLRAITRAPAAVQEAYHKGRISQTLAAKLGPKDPAPEQAATIAEIAREIRTMPDRKQVDALVRERLGVKRDLVGDLLRMFARLSREDRERFLQLATVAREAAE